MISATWPCGVEGDWRYLPSARAITRDMAAQGGRKHPPRRRPGSSATGFDDTRFDSQSVVHRDPELLLASEVALRRLDGHVAEQELDLIQFATRKVALALTADRVDAQVGEGRIGQVL